MRVGHRIQGPSIFYTLLIINLLSVCISHTDCSAVCPLDAIQMINKEAAAS